MRAAPHPSPSLPRRGPATVVALALALAALLAGCATASRGAGGAIVAVGAENEYANVIAQIGGRYVATTAIMSNPNTDPHSFEASPSVAQTVSQARLIVQNGLGYDGFMNKLESAAQSSARVIDVQKLLGLPDTTANPHLWYDPGTMPAVARAVAVDLAALDPAHAAYFKAGAARFDASLKPWYRALAQFKRRYPDTPVATTEPVADYLLRAAGADDLSPFSLQSSIMNGTDPAPQNVTLQIGLLSTGKVRAFIYNQQVTDTITQGFLKLAAQNHIPVIGVYETMPTPGYSYQSWMLAEVRALRRAVADGTSTTTLGGR